MKYLIMLQLKLNNTGIRRINGQTFFQEVETDKDPKEIVDSDSRFLFGFDFRKKITRLEQHISNFKEELSQEINELLLDELKGHNHSISRHNKFTDWLEKQEVKSEVIINN